MCVVLTAGEAASNLEWLTTVAPLAVVNASNIKGQGMRTYVHNRCSQSYAAGNFPYMNTPDVRVMRIDVEDSENVDLIGNPSFLWSIEFIHQALSEGYICFSVYFALIYCFLNDALAGMYWCIARKHAVDPQPWCSVTS